MRFSSSSGNMRDKKFDVWRRKKGMHVSITYALISPPLCVCAQSFIMQLGYYIRIKMKHRNTIATSCQLLCNEKAGTLQPHRNSKKYDWTI